MKIAAVGAALFILAAGPAPAQPRGPQAPRQLSVTLGKSLVIDSPVDIVRVSVADPAVVEAVGISPREIVLNGRKPGLTSVIVWQQGGGRLLFDVTTAPQADHKLATVQKELVREFEGKDVTLTNEEGALVLRGTVDSVEMADRAEAIAGAIGKPVNLLKVLVPEAEPQVLLKVRFANVDRAIQNELGANLFSSGAGGTIGSTRPGGAPGVGMLGMLGGVMPFQGFMLSDLLEVFLFRPDLNLGATIRALHAKRLIEILAEPNVLTTNGKVASFLAGGEYPYPVVQGGGIGGFAPVTLMFREFGIRLSFTPLFTSRGSIRLRVDPEVSALDWANAITFQGFNVPGLTTRRVSTEIELQNKQSFAIAGLLDNRLQETISKIQGLGDIPLLGKLFQSRLLSKNKSELLVLVTPEIVNPMPEGAPRPDIEFPAPFLAEGGTTMPRTPGEEGTGAVKVPPGKRAVPVEVLRQELKQELQSVPVVPSPGLRGGVGGAGAGTGTGAMVR
jgi:pilus assembly protein CpaC